MKLTAAILVPGMAGDWAQIAPKSMTLGHCQWSQCKYDDG